MARLCIYLCFQEKYTFYRGVQKGESLNIFCFCKNNIQVFNTISHLGPALCLLGIVLGVTNENKEETLTLVLFTIAVACMGALYSGFITNPQDIAPNFAGTYQ